jgi:hypothetical protein
MNEIEQAKKTLRDAGYFTDNLWHIEDVKYRFDECDDETAQTILESALTNELTMQHIFNYIDDIIDDKYRTL